MTNRTVLALVLVACTHGDLNLTILLITPILDLLLQDNSLHSLTVERE